MSTSTDGILCYGVDLGDCDEDPPEWLAKFIEDTDNCKDSKYPVKLVYHCSGEYPMYIIAAKGTLSESWRGSPKKPVMIVAPESERLLISFLREHDIKDNPSWLLASMWS